MKKILAAKIVQKTGGDGHGGNNTILVEQQAAPEQNLI